MSIVQPAMTVPPPTPTWGQMVAGGRTYIETAWWISLFPGLAIAAGAALGALSKAPQLTNGLASGDGRNPCGGGPISPDDGPLPLFGPHSPGRSANALRDPLPDHGAGWNGLWRFGLVGRGARSVYRLATPTAPKATPFDCQPQPLFVSCSFQSRNSLSLAKQESRIGQLVTGKPIRAGRASPLRKATDGDAS